MAIDDKKIIIDGEPVLYGTSIDCSPETSESTTQTFSGAIVEGIDTIPWTIKAEKVHYDSAITHLKLTTILENMLRSKKMVSVREIVRVSGEDPYEVVDDFYGCITTNHGFKIEAEDRTVNSLEFKAERRERHYYTLDGQEIKIE